MQKDRVFRFLGIVVIGAGVIGAVVTFVVINGQDFVVALLARVVEQPFELRSYLAIVSGGVVAVVGCLLGAIYLGIAEVLRAGGVRSESLEPTAARVSPVATVTEESGRGSRAS